MDEKEMQKLLEGIAEKNRQVIKVEIDAAVKGLITAEELSKRLDTAGAATAKQIEVITKALETQGEEIRKFFERGEKEKDTTKTIDEVIEEKAEQIKALKHASNGANNVKIKITREQINKTLVQRSAVAGNTMAYRVPGIGQIAVLEPVMSTLFNHVNVGSDSNGIIRWLDQNAITRGAAPVAESAVKPESVIDWIERFAPIEKIADSIPVTKEAWADLSFVKGEISNLLNLNIALKVDQQLWNGTGVTPNIKGVFTSAPEFVTTPYDDTIEAANVADLVAVVAADISNNKQKKYRANTVVINPITALRLKTLKDAEGRYVINPFASPDFTTISGMRVVESSQVAANTLLVGDFRYGTIYDLEGFNIEMGFINDQFIRNQMTILAEQRLMLLIKNVDADAFRKVSNITTALAALETPALP